MNASYTYGPIGMVVKTIMWFVQLLIIISLVYKVGTLTITIDHFLLIVIMLLLITFGTHLPVNFKTSPEGLFVQYYYWYIKIKWDDVLLIEKTKLSGIPFSNTIGWIIRIKDLPIIYRAIGLVTVFKWIPCVKFNTGLGNKEKFISDISYFTHGRVSLR